MFDPGVSEANASVGSRRADTQPLWVAAFATMWPTGVTMCELPKYSTPAGSAPMALAPMT